MSKRTPAELRQELKEIAAEITRRESDEEATGRELETLRNRADLLRGRLNAAALFGFAKN